MSKQFVIEVEIKRKLVKGYVMDKELYELCKEVYELTGWRFDSSSFMSRHWIYSFEGKTTGSYWEDVYDDYRNRDPFDDRRPTGITHRLERLAPLYTSDYLLEKILRHTNVEFIRQSDGRTLLTWNPEPLSNDYLFGASPLITLLKLTVALSEAGELK